MNNFDTTGLLAFMRILYVYVLALWFQHYSLSTKTDPQYQMLMAVEYVTTIADDNDWS